MQYNKIIKQEFKNLGKNIQILREKKNISLLEMAYKTGIRKEYLQKIENGIAYGVLMERHLLRIADALDVSIVNLF